MNILIINYYLLIGGVETLLCKLISELKHENKITLLLLRKKTNVQLKKEIEINCEIIYLSDLLLGYTIFKKKLNNFDVMLATNPDCFLWGSFILRLFRMKKTKILLGAYQTEMYCIDRTGTRKHRALIARKISNYLPKNNFIFPNRIVKKKHSESLGINYEDSPEIKIILDETRYKFVDKSLLDRNIIVSIGRIVDFKTYNFTVLKVIKKLLSEGYDLKWKIYGDGPLFHTLKKEIDNLGLENNVLLMGEIDHSEFQKVLCDCFLFIGSGLSLIEAAACGVPALTTIEYSKSAITYGFIGNIDGADLIEPGLNLPVNNIYDSIINLIILSKDDYLNIQRLCFNKTKEYSSKNSAKKYIEVFNNAKITNNYCGVSFLTLVKYYYLGFIFRIKKYM